MILIEANRLYFETVKSELHALPPPSDRLSFTLDEMNRSYSRNKQRLVQGTSPYERKLQRKIYYSFVPNIEYNVI